MRILALGRRTLKMWGFELSVHPNGLLHVRTVMLRGAANYRENDPWGTRPPNRFLSRVLSRTGVGPCHRDSNGRKGGALTRVRSRGRKFLVITSLFVRFCFRFSHSLSFAFSVVPSFLLRSNRVLSPRPPMPAN